MNVVDQLPDWEQLLAAAARLQKILPGATLVGGTAAAIAADHRRSIDADHVVAGLVPRFDQVLAELESAAGWKTARVRRPVVIFGSLDGILNGTIGQRSWLDAEGSRALWRTRSRRGAPDGTTSRSRIPSLPCAIDTSIINVSRSRRSTISSRTARSPIGDRCSLVSDEIPTAQSRHASPSCWVRGTTRRVALSGAPFWTRSGRVD